MEAVDTKSRRRVIVIGAGQAGLATGYYLSQLGEDFVIIDEGTQIGDSWSNRWDSLKLFTPAQYDGLPGLPFPGKRGTFPSKDEMAEYLRQYTQKFSLPVRLGVKALNIEKTENGFEILTSKGKMQSEKVVVATGTCPTAHVPAFAKDISADIFQIHSSGYIGPQSLPTGDVLVVGAGTSGVQIALELSKSRTVMISGRPTAHIPDPLLRYAGGLYWWLISNVLTVKTPIGRKVKSKVIHSGAPLISISFKDIRAAGIEHVPRVTGAKDGLPLLEDGRTPPVTSIVWATGFRPDFSWMHMNAVDETGWPNAVRGISKDIAGLSFVGLPFQFGLTSGLVGGMGRDAAFVTRHLHGKAAATG